MGDKSMYLVDIPSLHAHFPPQFPPPLLLLDFAKWLQACKGSIGCPKLISEHMVDWGGTGADLYHYLIPFMRTPCGSLIAFWLPDGKPVDSPSVVLIGSEGEIAVLGDSLEDFLLRLATSKTGDSDLDCRHEELRDEGPALAAWLKARGAKPPRRNRSLPRYVQWWKRLMARHQAWADKDPTLVSIADKLRELDRPPADPKKWWSASFEVVIVGTQFQMFKYVRGPKQIAARRAAEFEPLFRAERLRCAQAATERGLWFQAYVMVSREGTVGMNCSFLKEPTIADKIIRFPVADYRSDWKDFPRSNYWTPDWLRKKIGPMSGRTAL